MPREPEFSARLLEWFDTHGRHDLPWQRNHSAYAVWVSEIMLQQTQVVTVVGYFERFMARFPDVTALARAPLDDVLALWSGLGYYARARNLHSAARIVCDRHDGAVPDNFDDLTALPGVGRSTAGAILSIAFGVRTPILDGNVKRVLTRRAGIAEWPGKSAVSKQLWQLADELTPEVRVADYTQAIMDFGATLCSRAKPLCMHCPVSEDCRARADGMQARIPAARPRRERPRRSVRMLLVRDVAGAVLLERRPASGVWAGLFSLPELSTEASAGEFSREYLGLEIGEAESLATISHSFTHFDLDIEPLHAQLASHSGVMDRENRLWYKPGESQPPGMPAPVARLLESLA